MPAGPISPETSADARALMVDRFAGMTVSERAQIAEQLDEMCVTAQAT